jgi:hypothetical protein
MWRLLLGSLGPLFRCAPHQSFNWFWWKVELDPGLVGWVAEGGDNIDPYYICPVN